MKKKNLKNKTFTKHKPVSVTNSFSLIVVLKEGGNEQYKHLAESVSNIKDLEQDRFELVMISNDRIEKTNEYQAFIQTISNVKNIQTVSADTELTIGKVLGKIIQEIKNDYICIIDGDKLQEALNINLSSSRSNTLPDNSVGLLKFSEDNARNKKQGIYILPVVIAKYVYSNILKGKYYQCEALYQIRKLDIPVEEVQIQQSHPYTLKKHKASDFLTKILNWYNWFFRIPLREMKNKEYLKLAFIKQSSVFRFLFASVAIILLFLMPVMSYNAGISGDEYVQYVQATKVYDYYKTFGKDTAALYYDSNHNMPFYGQSFDNITAIYNEIFNVDNIYETRHVMNSLTGWIAILFSGLLATLIAGWRAGLLSLLIMFFSPRFLGHSWNNPKDVPFAMASILCIYYIARFIKLLPKFSVKISFLVALGIALAISVRIGGLLLIAYLFLFVGMYFLFSSKEYGLFSQENYKRLFKILSCLVVISLVGYLLGLILWPYGLKDPLHNPKNALEKMTHFATSLRQTFEGKVTWSADLPKYYITKYILMTIPTIVIVGLILFVLTIYSKKDKQRFGWNLLVAFSFVFPIVYIYYEGSNVYGGWRHAMFAYPPMLVASCLGLERFIRLFKKKIAVYIVYVVLLALAFHPIRHTIINHPYEYIYYNELFGGTKKAYGNYEMDYYYHGLKEGSEWLMNTLNKELNDTSNKIIIATNHYQNVEYYFRDYIKKGTVVLKYIRYYERGNTDWDYAIITNSYIEPYQLKKKIWPPKKTIYTVDVDGCPICAVVQRVGKDDYYGYVALQNNNVAEAVAYLDKAIKDDPANEVALLNMSQLMLNLRNFNKAIEYANMCLKVYPNYDRALNLVGIAYMNTGSFQDALAVFTQLTKVNYKFYTAYYNMAIIYAQMGNIDTAIQMAQKTLEYSNYKPAFYLIADLLKRKGMNAEAERFIQMGNSIK
ncbi:MAG: tetratricopeptide repeat protein [Bacteroidales bacterium]|nr:tetratricopeptide repeat protein [Bacteroidales bacterium]